MTQIKNLTILLLAVLLSQQASAQRGNAQDTVLKGSTIEIIQTYKPEVQRAPKPELTPYLPPVDTSKPNLQYNVPPQTVNYTYSSLPLRPLALNMSKDEGVFENYIKLGGGNLSTLYADAGIGSLKGENYETAIHLNHLSQSGNITNQKASFTGLDASGNLHKNNKVFGAKFGVNNSTYHYYGYDHNIYNYAQSSVRQSFTGINLEVDMQEEAAEDKQFTYHPTIGVNLFSDKYNASEISFKIGLPISYQLDSNTSIYVKPLATITSYKNPLTTQSNNVFQLAPGIKFVKNQISGHAGITPTWGANQKFYILPDIGLNYQLPETQLLLHAGWQGSLQQNTYQQLSMLNPYVFNTFTVNQTRTQEVYAGVSSNVGEHITFNGRVSWHDYTNLPVFINDTLTDNKQFQILYDTKVNAIGLEAAIRYQIAQTFAVGFTGQWMNFYQSNFERVWHRPGIRFTGDIVAQPIEKLTITAYISFIDELYALEKNNRSFKLNSILDIGAGAEYEVIKRVSLFLQANNLLNNKYQLQYGYNAFGMNIFGGARLKF